MVAAEGSWAAQSVTRAACRCGEAQPDARQCGSDQQLAFHPIPVLTNSRVEHLPEPHEAAGARGRLPEAEQDTARRFLKVCNLEQWVELWEKITDLTARADRVNLDRKQVVLSVFAALETTARG